MTEQQEIYYNDYFKSYLGKTLFKDGDNKIKTEDFITIMSKKE